MKQRNPIYLRTVCAAKQQCMAHTPPCELCRKPGPRSTWVVWTGRIARAMEVAVCALAAVGLVTVTGYAMAVLKVVPA